MILLETEEQPSLSEVDHPAHRRKATISDAGGQSDRVTAIRRAIADGTYVTPKKVEIMLDRLIEDLVSKP